MPEKKNENKPKRRTQVKEPPKNEKKLSKEEQKKVEGLHNIMDGIISNWPKR